MSLDRLIRLAQRTGDRLIVHDPANENDLVIMDVESYERLLDFQTAPDNLSWLEPEPWEKGIDKEMEDEMDELEDLDDDFAPGEEPSPWHSAAEVFNKRWRESDQPSFAFDRDEIKIEDIPFGPASAASTDWEKATQAWPPVPPAHSSPSPSAWGEEPLGEDEPVFYEEPV